MVFKSFNPLFQADGMNAQVKNIFRFEKKQADGAEIFGPGLIFATHTTHTHINSTV
jgi:hypothetical protein